MRRRDAIDTLPHLRPPTGWPTAVSFVLALTLHAALLALSRTHQLTGNAPLQLIPVTLQSGGAAVPLANAARAPAAQVMTSAQPVRALQVRTHPARRTSRSPAATADAVGPQLANAEVGTASAGSGASATGAGAGIETGAGDGADQRAACISCPVPRYPLVARARGWAGTVHVGLSVLADGTVEDASVRRSSGYGVLDEAAMLVARRSRFTPPGTRGLPTPLHGRIEYRFELSAAE